MRFVNSLQVQLYAILLLLIVLVIGTTYLNERLAEEADIRIDQSTGASLQRSNAYLLASLSRRLVNAETDATRNSVGALLDVTINNARDVEDGLRNGNEELQLEPIEQPELLLLLDDLDREWDTYLGQIEVLKEGTEVEQVALLERIDNQSVTVFTFADHLVKGLDVIIEQRQENVHQISIGIEILTVLTIFVAVFVVTYIARSINRLSTTANLLAGGDLTARTSSTPLIEVAQVGNAFNTMADRVQSLIVQLESQVEEAQKAREAAERSDQVKSAFLASMSHELRTPLNSVINFTKFVVRGVMGPVTERQQETLNKVIASGQHLLNLINDVLDMSKIESGSLNLFIEDDINLNEILKNVLASGEGIIADKPVALKREIQPDLPLMRGDRKRLTQIFLNIVSNACKYTKEGFVKVTAHIEDGELHIAVQDTGPGIAPEDQNAVFESFKQTDSGLRQGEGTGLGMPISKSLAEAHGGKIGFESAPGEGTTFYVTLPIYATVAQPTA